MAPEQFFGLLSVFLVCLAQCSSLDTCVDEHCQSCSECFDFGDFNQQLDTCNGYPSSNNWPAKPRDLTITWKEETFDQYPHLNISFYLEITPPNDISVDLIEGFRIKIYDVDSGAQACIWKNVTGCNLKWYSKIHFCFPGTYGSTKMFEAQTLPPSSNNVAHINSIEKTVHVNRTSTVLPHPNALVDIIAESFNGTENDPGAQVMVTFKPRSDWRNFRIYLIDNESNNREVARVEDVLLEEVSQPFSLMFRNLCGGSYEIEIQARETDDECLCKDDTYRCEHCPRTKDNVELLEYEVCGGYCEDATYKIGQCPTPPLDKRIDQHDENSPSTDTRMMVVILVASIFALGLASVVMAIVCRRPTWRNNHNNAESGSITEWKGTEIEEYTNDPTPLNRSESSFNAQQYTSSTIDQGSHIDTMSGATVVLATQPRLGKSPVENVETVTIEDNSEITANGNIAGNIGVGETEESIVSSLSGDSYVPQNNPVTIANGRL